MRKEVKTILYICYISLIFILFIIILFTYDKKEKSITNLLQEFSISAYDVYTDMHGTPEDRLKRLQKQLPQLEELKMFFSSEDLYTKFLDLFQIDKNGYFKLNSIALWLYATNDPWIIEKGYIAIPFINEEKNIKKYIQIVISDNNRVIDIIDK